MSDKEFKSIQEQIDILKSRGLSIDNEEQATEFLMRNNYYRVSGYSLTLRNHDIFSKSATFQNIIDIYKTGFGILLIFNFFSRNGCITYTRRIDKTPQNIENNKLI